jgi:hypothetical protein
MRRLLILARHLCRWYVDRSQDCIAQRWSNRLNTPAEPSATTRDFSTTFIACSFLTAAMLLWGGWLLLPVRIGTYFQPDDFGRVAERFHFWIWMYRLHLFGMVISAIALVALASLVTESAAKVLVWPGAAIATAGLIVGAVGAAFYYHHGAWGALELRGKSAEDAARFVEALRVDTEYVTCLVRFGRVFSGLGLVLVGSGLIKGRMLPGWLGWWAVVLGLAGMGVTMLLPDRMELYMPVFHAGAVWLAAMGVTVLRSGINAGTAATVSGER